MSQDSDKATADGEYHKYSKQQIQQAMNQLQDWELVKGKLHRELEFQSFEDAISFMGRAAMEVAKLDHHPEWSNVYNQVKIDLVTHDVGGLSNYDFKEAKILNQLLENYRLKKKKKKGSSK